MECAVQFSGTGTGTGRAGVKAWVVDAGVERTHTVPVILRAKKPITRAYLEISAPRPGKDADLSSEG
jgi:hypothetical protein